MLAQRFLSFQRRLLSNANTSSAHLLIKTFDMEDVQQPHAADARAASKSKSRSPPRIHAATNTDEFEMPQAASL